MILCGTGPRGGEKMTFTELSADELNDPVALLLNAFFTSSDASQAAGHAYLDRLNRREADRDTPVTTTAAAAQLSAIRGWGEIPSTKRYAMLRTIRQPTLIVHGTKDGAHPRLRWARSTVPSVVGWSGWSDSNDFGRPTLNVSGISYPSPSASAPEGAFSWGARSSVRTWSIWSFRRTSPWRGVVIVSPLRASDSWVWPPRTLRHFPSSFPWIKEALLSVLTAVIPVLLPLREVVPELAYLHREERVHSKIQPGPYDLCTHSEQEP